MNKFQVSHVLKHDPATEINNKIDGRILNGKSFWICIATFPVGITRQQQNLGKNKTFDISHFDSRS
jgi:hypothetical protein